jgi:Tol biopolymer transport system component
MKKNFGLRTCLGVLFFSFFLAGCAGWTRPLPNSLYFLNGKDETSQVWRLERNGVTLSQISTEEMGVEDFSVSQVDGAIALVTDGKLILMDASGKDRRLIADGKEVLTDGEEFYFRNTLSNPSFSPDGHTLAYGLDGIHLYDLKTGVDDHVLTNLGLLMDEPYIFAKEVYSPGAWSPDGTMLLITMSYYEGYTLAVMRPGEEQPYMRLKGDGALCCMNTWTNDSRSVLVANPYFLGTLPGLWRLDATSGGYEYVIPGHEDYQSFNFVGWPYQSGNGDLTFFYVHQDDFSPEIGTPLSLVHTDENGENMEKLMPGEFRIRNALWSQDGTKVVVAGSYDGSEMQLILIDPLTQKVDILVEEGGRISNLTWGP